MTTKPTTEQVREEFERLISEPPYEKSLARWDDSPKSAWPGHYKDYEVQLAFDIFRAAHESSYTAGLRDGLERAAHECDRDGNGQARAHRTCCTTVADTLAAAIRALKDKP